ncbi:MAG TPA: flavodoxin domain-containing protein [Candidatus Limnocylindrales bacterium]|nr:flavodoxin domain-containing protein [Candidatus Limnocylindrales bacterium]
MERALVVYASRHGSTQGIAERIGEVLRAHGVEAVVVEPASHAPDPSAFDGVVVGSGVYMGSWLGEGIEYLERNVETLAGRKVWLFSSGPLPGSTKEAAPDADRYGGALGPAEGPGSGGRHRIEALADAIHVRDHRVFQGAFDPNDGPKSIAERFVRLMPAAKDILPPGDFRQWDLIEAWAREIAAEITAVPA